MRNLLLVVMIFSVSLMGCAQNRTRVAEGAGAGGALGALAGGIIGYQSGHLAQGALIGGAIGAGGGALAGSRIEKPSSTVSSTTTTTTNQAVVAGEYVTIQQVVGYSKQGLSSDEIIARIQNSHSTYRLTADDVDYLYRNGVSQRVIDFMRS
jgi:uncharacterized protein YcfJ